jgi:hypothetical protein
MWRQLLSSLSISRSHARRNPAYLIGELVTAAGHVALEGRNYRSSDPELSSNTHAPGKKFFS